MSGFHEHENLLKKFLSDDEIELSRIKGDFTAKLIKFRKKKNLTQTELAKKAGLRQSAIARIENEGAMPRLDTVYKLFGALDVEFIIDHDEYYEESNYVIKMINSQFEELVEIAKLQSDEIKYLKKSIKELSSKVCILNDHVNDIAVQRYSPKKIEGGVWRSNYQIGDIYGKTNFVNTNIEAYWKNFELGARR